MSLRSPRGQDEGGSGAGRGEQPGADPGQGRRDEVLLDRRIGVSGQAVALGRLGEQEERPQSAGQLLVRVVAGAVEIGASTPALVQLGDAPLGQLDELVVGAELDRVGRTGLRARRLQPVLSRS